ncbi:MAG: hypothetical protein J4428_02575 [Candidatus Aenigmarchaeota archaeon]|nr:hypothetical protein [Candidatus Aenigmarchaeota archaeon]
MKFSVVLWGFWVISVTSLIISAKFLELTSFLVLMSILAMIGIQLYYNERNYSLLKKFYNSPNSIDEKLQSIEKEIIEKRLDNFNSEMKLEDFRREQEKKYREITKRVFELDNKFVEKFDTLGKVVVKLGKDLKKS